MTIQIQRKNNGTMDEKIRGKKVGGRRRGEEAWLGKWVCFDIEHVS
jgi:hypothetical protein